MKINEITNAATSAIATDHHIESPPITAGRISTARSWNTRVRRNEIVAEIRPLLSAVKNPEAKIFSPAKRKDGAKSLKA